jgi:hypothetical protein
MVSASKHGYFRSSQLRDIRVLMLFIGSFKLRRHSVGFYTIAPGVADRSNAIVHVVSYALLLRRSGWPLMFAIVALSLYLFTSRPHGQRLRVVVLLSML